MASPVTAAAGASSTGVPRRSYSSSSTLCSAAAPTGEEILAHFGDRASSFQGTDIVGAMESLANADAVCFDVDSTVIAEEGIVSFSCRCDFVICLFEFVAFSQNLNWSDQAGHDACYLLPRLRAF
jgi:hypothetical protein